MRAIIDLDKEMDRALKLLARARGASRSQVVREAIAHYLKGRQVPPPAAAFGAWGARRTDGVAYQRRLRKEWTDS